MRVKITKAVLDGLWRDVRASEQAAYVYDTEIRGFGARVATTGVSFFVEYRIGGRGGRNRRMAIGRFGDLTVEQARRKAQRLRADIVDGRDVMQARDDARRRLAGDRYAGAVERYLELNARDTNYWQEVRRLLLSQDVASLRTRALATIKRSELVAILDQATARSPSTARVLHAALRPFFAWCVPRGLIEASPLDGVRPPAPPPARDRVLDAAEIRALWGATEALGHPYKEIFRLLLLTGQRRSEVAGMRWSELDLPQGTWAIGATRTKNSKPHIVDLGPRAQAVLSGLSRGDSDLVFTTNGRSAPSGFSKAKRRLDEVMAVHLGDDMQPWRLHDLRRTAASGMAGLNVPPHVVERVLNHVSGAQGGLVGVYQRYEYRTQRRDALQAWDARIGEIMGMCGEHSNVVAFRGALH